MNVSHPLLSLGDWSCGKRSGHGSETSQYGTYEGGWRNGMKYGHGVEKTLVGTIFRGQWERWRKHATGTRKLPFGLTEEQVRSIHSKSKI